MTFRFLPNNRPVPSFPMDLWSTTETEQIWGSRTNWHWERLTVFLSVSWWVESTFRSFFTHEIHLWFFNGRKRPFGAPETSPTYQWVYQRSSPTLRGSSRSPCALRNTVLRLPLPFPFPFRFRFVGATPSRSMKNRDPYTKKYISSRKTH